MNKRIFFLFFFLLFTCLCHSQTRVEGVVVNEKGEKIDGVIVTLVNKDGDIVAYKTSDRAGAFVLSTGEKPDDLQIVASLLGYETKTVELKGTDGKVTITLEQKAIELKEVNVKSNLMWRKEDTIVYNVEAFKEKQDQTIGDVIKKLPGVEVAANGQIKHNGEALNKFYVEGMDLLGGKYGIATNNVPVDAVQTIELIENHEPVNMLKDISTSTQSAINLKLKNSKLAKPVGNITAGTGTDGDNLLWLASIFSMYAGKNQQAMVSYKTNNTGTNIANELNMLTANVMGASSFSTNSPEKSLFNDNLFGNVGLSSKRYLFNRTHIATFNRLYKVNRDGQLRVNVDYANDGRDEKIERISSYMLPDSILSIHETTWNERTSNLVDAKLTYTGNAKTFYLNNLLDAKLKWSTSTASVMTVNNLVQKYSTPEYVISNDMQFIRRFGSRVMDIHSKIHYSSLPQELNVLRTDSTETHYSQPAHYSGLYANLATSLSFVGTNYSLSMKFMAEGAVENLHSRLTHQLFTDSTVNDIHSDYIVFHLSPSFVWQPRRVKFTLTPYLKQYNLNIVNDRYQESKKMSRLFLLPRLSVYYEITSLWNALAGYSFNQSVGDLFDLAAAPIMYGYRNITVKSGILSNRQSEMASIRLNFRNPLTTLFFNTTLQYSTIKRNLLNAQRFVGINAVSGNIERENRMETLSWSAYVGKYIRSIRTNMSLTGSVIYNKSEKLQQDVLYPVNSRVIAALPKISAKVNDHINAEYTANMALHNMSVKTAAQTTENNTGQISQTLGFHYFIKKMELNLQGEYLYSKVENNVSSNTFFADTRLRFNTKYATFELSWNNMLNNKSYRYMRYSDLDTYSYNYHLRPSNILASVSFRY